MVEAMIEGRKEGRIVSNFNFEIHDFEFFFSSLTQRFVETKQNRGNWDLGKQFEKNSPLALQPFTKKTRKVVDGLSLGVAVVESVEFRRAQCVARLCGCPKRTSLNAVSATRVRSRDFSSD